MSLFYNNVENKKKYFAIFGGGGIRGIAYCGAYKALLENNIELTGLAGSSIGAVFASLIAVGYSFEEVYEFLFSVGLDMFKDININFKKEPAISKGNVFYDWIKEKIEKKFYADDYVEGAMEPVKFKDIEQKLVIYSVDLTNLKYKEFSNYLTPNFEIASAVRASVSMPGLFKPLQVEDSLVVDGDLLKSCPLWKLSSTIKSFKERIIEFRLEDNESSKNPDGAIEYINRVYNAISGFATDNIIKSYKYKDKFEYIKINTPDVSVVDFTISEQKRKELYEIGYNSTNDYFNRFYIEKKNALFQKYNILLAHFLKFQKQFKKTNIVKSYLNLCEIFVYLCEERDYFDNSILDEIFDFKTQYLKHYKKNSFFIFKKAEMEQSIKDELLAKLSKIVEQIGLKVKGQ